MAVQGRGKLRCQKRTITLNPYRFSSDAEFERHCEWIETARPLIRGGDFAAALTALDQALEAGESPNAHWNRALTLLALGRYREGFCEYQARSVLFAKQWEPGLRLQRDLPLWGGEDLRAKRLVLIHEAGFGDAIMMLRYVPALQQMGIDVALAMPRELERLARQLAPMVGNIGELDVQCQLFDLMRILGHSTEHIPIGAYLKPDPELRAHWSKQIKRPAVGISWSSLRDLNYWRSVPLKEFLALLPVPRDWSVVSLQTFAQDEAREQGVVTPPIEDFADMAAIASLMDEIVSIDTATLHIAGAIGHPNAFGVMPQVMCWRWLNGNPWHPVLKLCPQLTAGDWSSAFAQIPPC
jgi:hypothetical protein